MIHPVAYLQILGTPARKSFGPPPPLPKNIGISRTFYWWGQRTESPWHRDTEGVASRQEGYGVGRHLPSWLGDLGERHKLPPVGIYKWGEWGTQSPW